MSNNFSFRWSEFDLQRNIELKEIRDNSELLDVTLACDDGQIGAHKLILRTVRVLPLEVEWISSRVF